MKLWLLLALAACNTFAQTYYISTISGIDRLAPGLAPTAVPFWTVQAIAFDPAGNLYIADFLDNRVRRVSPSGEVTTVAGNGTEMSYADNENVPATSISVIMPSYVTADGLGNTYLVDDDVYGLGELEIRKVSPDGLITTIAGGEDVTDDDFPARYAQILGPMAADAAGNVFVSGFVQGYCVRKIGLDGIIQTIAGTGVISQITVLSGPALQVNLSYVSSLALDGAGNIYFADSGFGLVRKLTPDGFITTVAGTLTPGSVPTASMPATSASISPEYVALDGDFLYIISLPEEPIAAYLYRVTLSTGVLDILAGGAYGYSGDGGPASLAHFGNTPVVAAGKGAIYIGEGDHVRIIQNGIISNFAGAFPPDDVPANTVAILKPRAVSKDAAGNVLFTQAIGNALERIGTDGIIHHVSGPWKGADGVASDPNGDSYVSSITGQIYRVPPVGDPVLIGGTGTPGATGDNGPALQATFDITDSIAADGAGNVYIGAGNDLLIRKISAATGIVTTIAGNNAFDYLGDDVPPLANGIVGCGLAVGPDQNLYIGDPQNNHVLQLTPAGKLTTIAGDGQYADRGDGGPATLASLNGPCKLVVDSKSITELYGEIVRKIDATGIITTIGGNGIPFPLSLDNGPALDASLSPMGVAVGPNGVIYVADYSNDRIRKLEPLGTPHTVTLGASNASTELAGQSFPFTVTITDSSGAPVASAPVSFEATPQNSATFNPTTTTTGPDGTATTQVTLGPNTGPTTITAFVPGLASSTLAVLVQNGPVINAGGIVGAALSSPPTEALSPNGLISIFGTGFAAAGTSELVTSSDLVNGTLPTVLAGVCVRVGGADAYMLYVSPNQVNVQLPTLLPTNGSAGVRVIRNCNTSSEAASNLVSTVAQDAAPEFFYLSHGSDGISPIAAFDVSRGTLVSASAPAYPGDIVSLFGTGFGATMPPVEAGVLPTAPASLANPAAIAIGGIELASADLLYAGVSSFAGLYQLNIQIPVGTAPGNKSIVVTVGGNPSPLGASLAVAAP